MKNSVNKTFSKFNAKDYKVGIVVAQFNADVTAELLKYAKKMLAKYKVLPKNVKIINVAGCVEAPVVLKAMAETGEYDALIALGCVIRGETAHFDYVCKIASEGILRVMMDYGISVGFGILTVENKEQALERLGAGGFAVSAALQTAKEIKLVS